MQLAVGDNLQTLRRRGIAALAALALHGLLIYGASRIEPRLSALWSPAHETEVLLERAPEIYFSPHAKAKSSTSSATRAALAPLRPHRPPKILERASPTDLPLLPTPPVPANPPGPGLQGHDEQGDLRGALRAAIGCSHEEFLALNPAERARCNWQLANGQAYPRIDHMTPERRAQLDSEAALNENRRLGRQGSVPQVIVACTDPGSNFGVGCLPH